MTSPHCPIAIALRGKVLVADDHEASRAVFGRMLTRFGCAVTPVTNGSEAVQAVRAEQFDLVLMDGRMPVLDGYAAARQIRDEEQETRVPIVLMTASTAASDRDAALAVGMDGVLGKPTSLEELRAVLDRWCPAPTRAQP